MCERRQKSDAVLDPEVFLCKNAERKTVINLICSLDVKYYLEKTVGRLFTQILQTIFTFYLQYVFTIYMCRAPSRFNL